MSTPEAPELQGFLAAMVAAGDDWAVVESTSHGLAQQRVAGVAYDVGGAHQYHLRSISSSTARVEAYREAKRGLFARLAVSDENPEKGHGKHAVVNADDSAAEGFSRTAIEAAHGSSVTASAGGSERRALRP